MSRRKSFKVIYTKLGRGKVWRRAYADDNIIEIDERAKGKKHLELLIHEVSHLLFPALSEEEIISKSITLTNLLWKEHYRRVDNSNSITLQDGKK